jgi:hypothetical protein
MFTLAFFLLLQISAVYAVDEGKVSGEVVNLTTEKPLPSQEVILKGWKGESPVLERKATTDESGRFEFSGLKVGNGLVYEVATNYKGVDYSSPQFALTKDKSEITLTVKVYEVSEDTSNISIPVYHVVLRESNGSFEVFETFSVMNTGKTSFPNLSLELPKGSGNLELIQGFMECCAEVSGNRILHTMALKPGGEVFSLRYRLKRSESLDLSRAFPFDVKRLMVITQLDTISTSSPGFRPREIEEVEGRTFYTFLREEVKGGEPVEVLLSTGVKPQNNLIWVVASFAFVLVFGAFFAFSLRRRSRASMEERALTLAQHEKVLLAFISKLDEMREAGDIPEEIYEEFKGEQERKLRKVQAWLSRNRRSNSQN